MGDHGLQAQAARQACTGLLSCADTRPRPGNLLRPCSALHPLGDCVHPFSLIHSDAAGCWPPASCRLPMKLGMHACTALHGQRCACGCMLASRPCKQLHPVQVIQDLIKVGPTVIRGNASEILAAAGAAGAGRGVDSSAAVSEAVGSSQQLAQQAGCVVAVSGSTDMVCWPGSQAWAGTRVVLHGRAKWRCQGTCACCSGQACAPVTPMRKMTADLL